MRNKPLLTPLCFAAPVEHVPPHIHMKVQEAADIDEQFAERGRGLFRRKTQAK